MMGLGLRHPVYACLIADESRMNPLVAKSRAQLAIAPEIATFPTL